MTGRLTSKNSEVSTNDNRENTNLRIGVIIILCFLTSTGTSLWCFVSTHLKLPCINMELSNEMKEIVWVSTQAVCVSCINEAYKQHLRESWLPCMKQYAPKHPWKREPELQISRTCDLFSVVKQVQPQECMLAAMFLENVHHPSAKF